MKEFISLFEKDFRKEGFTKKEYIVYGVVAPVVLILLMGFAGWLETKMV